MAKMLHLFIIVALTLLTTTTALAAVAPSTRQTDNGPCIYETIDACFHDGDWWYENTSTSNGYKYSDIDCGLIDGCNACGTTSLGKPICVQVQYDAACKCRVEPLPGAGPNIVYCKDEGTCHVR